ncbi:MAG: AAA family ATPase [Propionibacteriaceae bacterium]|nr:AAA family ATPase [Propionibacteriaceae bacterium]
MTDSAAVRVDIDQAEQHANEGQSCLDRAPALAVEATRRALDLLSSGGLLANEPDTDWAEPARAHADRLVRRVRLIAAEAALRTADAFGAREIAQAAVMADPLDETAWRALMRAHQLAGEPGEALAAYERLRTVLAAELGSDPAPQTRDLHLAVLREQEVASSREHQTGETGPPHLAVTLAGREPEVAILAQAWTNAAAGRPALLAVTGEAGIGKTRLTEEMAGLARSQ